MNRGDVGSGTGIQEKAWMKERMDIEENVREGIPPSTWDSRVEVSVSHLVWLGDKIQSYAHTPRVRNLSCSTQGRGPESQCSFSSMMRMETLAGRVMIAKELEPAIVCR